MNLLLELTKDLKPLSGDRFLLAVSGGLDSMALLEIFDHFKEHFGFQLAVAHVHHGPAQSQEQSDFRLGAFHHVKKTCQEKSLPFFSNFSEGSEPKGLPQMPLKSEADCREYRYACLNEWMEQHQMDHLVLAHHWDDLLETRLLRLIRGVGPESLGSMEFQQGKKLRPLLKWSRSELEKFLVEKNTTWVEDPSNRTDQNLRVWLRNQWIPALESRQAGASKSLARSLDRLVEGFKKTESGPDLSQLYDQNGLILSEFLILDLATRRQVLATYMKGQGLKNYGLSHINEILKRLDTDQKRLTFKVLGCLWRVDAGRMRVQRPGQFETSEGE